MAYYVLYKNVTVTLNLNNICFLDSKCMDLSNLSGDDPNFIEGKC